MDNEGEYIHYSIVLSKIEKSDNSDEIAELYYKNRMLFKTDTIDWFIHMYRMTLSDDDKRLLAESLKEKIKIAKEIITNKEKLIKESKILSIVNNIDFKMFLNQEIKSVDSFCKLFGIDNKIFFTVLNYLEKENNDLYMSIRNKIDNLKRSRFSVLANKVDFIVDCIINGIKDDNDKTREFQVLDYFLMTKLSYDEFIRIYISCKNVTNDKLRAVKTFLASNKLTSKINMEAEINGKTIF